MSTASYTPGTSPAAVAPQGVVVLRGDARPDLVAAAWQQLRAGGGIAGVIDVLAAGRALSDLPSFAIVLEEDEAWRVAVRGDFAVAGSDGAPIGLGSGSLWSERSVSGAASLTVLTAPADDPPAMAMADGVVLVASIIVGRADAAASPAPAVSRPVTAAEVEPVQPHTLAEVRDAGVGATGLTDSIPDHLRPPQRTAPGKRSPISGLAPEPEAPSPISFVPGASRTAIAAAPGAPAAEGARRVTPPPPTRPSAATAGPDPLGEVEATLIRGADDPAPAVAGDHDGETVSLAEARRLREAAGSAPSAPAPPARVAGRVRLSTGQAVALDRTVIVGRRPRTTRATGTDLPHLISVASPQQDISRNHIEIRSEGDSILVTDLQTTNGTILHRPGADPVRLHPGEPTMIVPGDVLDLGDGVTVTVEDVA